MKNTIEYYESELKRAKYVLNKIKKKDWFCLPEEYEREPQEAIKHFQQEIEYWEEKIGNHK
jgi:hypothetical protein